MIHLTDAIVAAPPNMSRSESKAVAVLVEEVESHGPSLERASWPAECRAVIAVGPWLHCRTGQCVWSHPTGLESRGPRDSEFAPKPGTASPSLQAMTPGGSSLASGDSCVSCQ